MRIYKPNSENNRHTIDKSQKKPTCKQTIGVLAGQFPQIRSIKVHPRTTKELYQIIEDLKEFSPLFSKFQPNKPNATNRVLTKTTNYFNEQDSESIKAFLNNQKINTYLKDKKCPIRPTLALILKIIPAAYLKSKTLNIETIKFCNTIAETWLNTCANILVLHTNQNHKNNIPSNAAPDITNIHFDVVPSCRNGEKIDKLPAPLPLNHPALVAEMRELANAPPNTEVDRQT